MFAMKELERSEKQQGLVSIGKTTLVGEQLNQPFLSRALPASSVARAARSNESQSIFLGIQRFDEERIISSA